jgi:hypothetical protein
VVRANQDIFEAKREGAGGYRKAKKYVDMCGIYVKRRGTERGVVREYQRDENAIRGKRRATDHFLNTPTERCAPLYSN